MRNTGICPQCGSKDVCNDAHTDIGLAVDADPAASFLRRTACTDLAASVCLDCGYTELFALDTTRIRAAARQAAKRRI